MQAADEYLKGVLNTAAKESHAVEIPDVMAALQSGGFQHIFTVSIGLQQLSYSNVKYISVLMWTLNKERYGHSSLYTMKSCKVQPWTFAKQEEGL